ncbi:DUF2510 domain-containing protein [Mycobacterium sp. E2733]|uniref:DUF2510 domain-containing protein n=1 Tax=Mycobacterium sp. E2733 TaxID=1834138 RepID=UPI0018D40A47
MKPNQHPQSLPPPTWWPDPAGTNRLRWWDGSRWTDHYAQIPAPQPPAPAVPALPATHNSSPITAYPLQPAAKSATPRAKGERWKLISTCRYCRCGDA